MPITVKDHGVWRPYTPDPMPDWAIEASKIGGAIVFVRRDGDGVDWYAYVKTGPFAKDSIVATTISEGDPRGETVKAVFRDVSMIFPFNHRLIEIDGVDPAETKPHNLFAWMIFDPVNLRLTGEPVPPQPIVPDLSVSAAQALIQLSRMPHDGSVVPGAKNLAEATEALVAQSGDYELKTWFARAQRWVITNPNVQKIGAAFHLSADDIRSAFEAAAKIEE